MKNFLTVTLGLLLLKISTLMAQEAPVVVPPSPEAASLAKNTNFPDATYNGVPEIKVPIYELPLNTINYKIELNYNSQGFRIDEESSAVGLGWNLSSTSVITRAVSALDDFSSQGFFRHNPSTYTSSSGRDPSPDIFSFNINGQTGKFIINHKPANPGGYEISMLQQSPLKFEILADTTWKIIDAKGLVYLFAQKERSRKETPVINGVMIESFVSSWYLSQIVAPDGEQVSFIYRNSLPVIKNRYESRSIITYTNYVNPCNPYGAWPNNSNNLTWANTQNQQILLEKIVFPNGEVEFLTSTRTDLDYQGSIVPRRYIGIKVKRLNGEIVRDFSFNQDYFVSGSGRALRLSTRLKLNFINELVLGIQKKLYSFDYYTPNLPDKDSFAKDYWGGFNGAFTNNDMFGNREPNSTFVIANLLKTINFSTGGKRVYTYESNDYNNFTSAHMDENPPLSQNGGRVGPGCRIAKIEKFDEYNQPVDSRTYNYTIQNGNSTITSGKRMAGSKYLTQHNRLEYSGSCPYAAQSTYTIRSSENNFAGIDPGSGYIIGYNQVTVNTINNGQNGKVEYLFTNNPSVGSERFIGLPIFLNNLNGSLEKTITYKKSGTNFLKVYETTKSTTLTPVGSVTARIRLPDNVTGTYYIHTYNIPFDWIHLNNEINQSFDNSGSSSHQENKSYFYDNIAHKQITRESMLKSDGSTHLDFYTYPLDYSNGNSSIDQMKNNHLVAYPIEHVQIVKRGTVESVIKGVISTYKVGGQGLKDIDYYLDLTIPLARSSFKFSNRSVGTLPPIGANTVFSMDSRYKPRLYYQLYENGKLAQYKLEENGTENSFIWGYSSQHPVASFENTTKAKVSYTSFEIENEKGGWTYSGVPVTNTISKTGLKYYNLSTGGITKSSIGASSSTPYRLTFWARRASGSGSWNFMGQVESLTTEWKLIQRTVSTSSITISEPGVYIDELRLLPSEAIATTYTYIPLTGISSICDTRNNIIYFEYDSNGRLLNKLNERKEIMETFEYNYKGAN